MILAYINETFNYSDPYSYKKFKDLFSHWAVTSNIKYFQKLPSELKIAILYNSFVDTTPTDSRLDEIKYFSDIADLVFVVENELFHNWAKSQNFKPNVHIILPGSPGITIRNSLLRPYWLQYVSDIYRQLPDKLTELNPYQSKPKMFDALLGYPRDYRTFIYDSILKNNLQNHILTSYNTVDTSSKDHFYAKDYFIWEPGTELLENENLEYTSNYVSYLGIRCMLSAVMPIQVYNQTAYSIVAETHVKTEVSFFTEKIAKPLLARRLFVVFANYRYLYNLRQLGFRTFNGIIDESYDEIYNNENRWAMAFEQVRQLCNRNQQEIFAMIKPIVEHNYQLMMDTDWDQQTADYITHTVKNVL